jgi:protein-tyrosine phosphatase
MSTRVIQVRSDEQIASAAAEGAAAIQDGALVGFATETVYGVAALASRPDALERLRELKNRPTRPFSLHLGGTSSIARYVADIPLDARRLIRKALPGPMTLILPTGGRLADDELQAAGLHDVLVDEGFLGIRCPDEPVARAMLAGVDGPVVAPSANLAGQPSPRDGADVLGALDGRIDLLIDSGPTRYGADSTIIRFESDGAWEILRQGVIDERMIDRLLKWKLLFVCTGNTCRSPLAAALAKKMLAERAGIAPDQLDEHGWEVISAGLFAADGLPATPEAREAAAELGAELGPHRSRRLTPELIRSADLIFCMTGSHVEQVLGLSPEATGKVRLLGESDVPDPIGGGSEQYRRTARQIEEALKQSFDRELE